MIIVAAGQAPGTGIPPELVSEYRQTYPGRADQVRNVRQDVAKHLGECPAADDAVLIASEFSTNSILHSRSRGDHFTIRIALYLDRVRVECHDAGGVWRGGRHTDDRPHGLTVVAALTGPAGWGVQTTGDGGRIAWVVLTW
jgi:serine/threonine-protein kinase RsbW